MESNLPNKYITGVYTIGYISVIVASMLHFFEVNWAFYMFSAGALMVIGGRALSLPKGDYSTRRLNMILGFGAVLLVASVYFMFKGSNSWAVTLVLSAFIDLYTSFRYNRKG